MQYIGIIIIGVCFIAGAYLGTIVIEESIPDIKEVINDIKNDIKSNIKNERS